MLSHRSLSSVIMIKKKENWPLFILHTENDMRPLYRFLHISDGQIIWKIPEQFSCQNVFCEVVPTI